MNFIKENYEEDILIKADERAGDLEPWPNYFESKTREFKTILNFYKFTNLESILEIGCGNGFTASLLSKRAEQVVAFDLPVKDAVSHSIGIDIAKELIHRLGIENISLIGGSAEDLPFPDNCFNLIFSEYMLHYVKKKDKALKEIRRVLHPDGTTVTLVPNFVERLVAPLAKYEYILKRLLCRIARREGFGKSDFYASNSDNRSIFKTLDYWLLLRSDGAYKSFMEEVFRHTLGSWRRLFQKNGFKVIKTFSTELLPLGLFSILGPSVTRFISRKAHILNNAFGNMPLVKHIGYSLGLVCRKD